MYRDFLVVTNRKLYTRPIEEQIRRIIKNKPIGIILREKDMDRDEYRDLAVKIIDICRENNIELMLHSYVDVAIELDYKKIHLPLHIARTLEGKISFFDKIGISIHSVEEAIEAETLGASYITAGHIYKTDCKKDLEPRGLDFLKKVCNSVAIPVYGIGGINLNNIEEVKSCGARGGTIMSYASKINEIIKKR